MVFFPESHGFLIDVCDQGDTINRTLEFFSHLGILRLLEILLAVPDCTDVVG